MNEIPSSECVNSPIISKTPGSTRIFNRSESRSNKRNGRVSNLFFTKEPSWYYLERKLQGTKAEWVLYEI